MNLFRRSHIETFGRRVVIDAGGEEAAVERILEELAREIHAYAGVRMHRLGVCEWEVKLCIASAGSAYGSWRVVVANVTGHTCTVHVSVFLHSCSKKGLFTHHILDPLTWALIASC